MWKFRGKTQFPHSFGRILGTMRKLCLSTKFLYQEIRWNYGILRSAGIFQEIRFSKYSCRFWNLQINFLAFLWSWLWQRWGKRQWSSIWKENDLGFTLLTRQDGCCIHPNNILKAVLIKKAFLGDNCQWVEIS